MHQHNKSFASRRNKTRSTSQKTRLVRSVAPGMTELLESRQLLSTSLTLSNGVLTLRGDPIKGSSLTASLDSSGKHINAGADQGHIGTYNLSAVHQIDVIGGSGNDYIYIDSAIKVNVSITGGDGNDVIRGGGAYNVITDGNGTDWISTRGTHNLVTAGNGNDTILGGAGNDTIKAGSGNDYIDGAGGNDSITAGNGRDTIFGSNGNDSITAGNGSDSINGGLGNDSMVSGTGKDTIVPGSGNNYVMEGNSADVIIPSSGNTKIVNSTGQTVSPADENSGSGSAVIAKWTTISAAKPSDSTAPRAIMNILAPVPMVGIAVNVRALDSMLGAGTPITANYQWNFGDPGGEYNTLPGYNASHVYDAPGTYTVKLTITNQLGKSSTASAQITIAADSRKTIYVDAVNGKDSNNGSSPTQAVKTADRADQLVGNNTQVLFHAGQTFNMDKTFLVPFSNVLIGSYATGAKPVMMLDTVASGAVLFSTQALSVGVTIDNLAFNTKTSTLPFAIVPRGYDITVRSCTFIHVLYAVNANSGPVGLTVMDSTSPNPQGLYGYFVWDQGTDTVVLGNTVAGSVNEHVMRTSSATEVLAYQNNFTNNDGKGCIEIHNGSYAWIQNNTVANGDIRVGPLGLWGEPASSATDYAVIQGNVLHNTAVNMYPGAHHISVRNNVIQRNGGLMIDIMAQDTSGRQSSDIQILNNTGISNSSTGVFLKVDDHTDGIILANNLLVQPNLATGGYSTAPVFVQQNSLNSFSYIGGNVWQEPKTFYGYAHGGINFVGASYATDNGYLTPSQWNGLPQVAGDVFSNTKLNSDFAPMTGNVAATADSAIAGVFTDMYGNARPTDGSWSAGAVQD
jgi:PKD domain/RTX calcium-binding nonapeptide repeat (4 copies)